VVFVVLQGCWLAVETLCLLTRFEQEPSSSPVHASKQSQQSPTTTFQQTKTKSINKSEEQSKTLENKDPEIINHYTAIFFVGCLIVWFD
jgi:hypothetical protein